MQRPLHPLHAICLAGTFTMFLGVLFSDIAYFVTYEVQWKNFVSWLLVGGLVFCGLTLLGAVVELIRIGRRVPRKGVYFLLLLAAWILGFIDALVHAGDAWASMPEGLILSAIVAALLVVATWSGFSHSIAGAAE